MRKRLVDFLEWYIDNEYNYESGDPDEYVDAYLKSNNQASDKSQIISDNEISEEDCGHSAEFLIKVDLGYYCRQCDRIFSPKQSG